MWKLKVSPRVLKATEKYIASLGRKREELTEEQWKFILNYIKGRRVVIPILVVFGLFCVGMTILYWNSGHKTVARAIPHDTVKISVNNQKDTISLSPEEIRQYLDYVTDCYMNAGVQIMLGFQLLVFAFLSATLARIHNRKMHRILLSRPPPTGIVV